jgi:hypothetical protein
MVRARGAGMLMSLVFVTVVSMLGFRACSSAGSNSPESPANMARVGVAGLCANQAAVATADGSSAGAGDTPSTLLSPEMQARLSQENPAALSALTGGAGNVTCPPADAATP